MEEEGKGEGSPHEIIWEREAGTRPLGSDCEKRSLNFFPESIQKLDNWPSINIHGTTELMGESNSKIQKKKVTLFCLHPLITFIREPGERRQRAGCRKKAGDVTCEQQRRRMDVRPKDQ